MSHSLPVRHRPRRFAEVTGQASAVDVLCAAANTSPVPQQLLLAGPSGVGKTTLARVFAAALFCSAPVPRQVGVVEGRDACGECESCLAVVGPGGKHPDVIEIDAASYGGVDQIRTLGEQAHLAPLQADKRIYVIDEAHGLTRDGGQAFLKLLEEPPAHTLFVLATTDPQKLPVALRGRCVQVFVSAPETSELVANLHRIAVAEGWALDETTAELVVAATDPALGVRGTVATLEKLSAHANGGVLSAQVAATVLGVADPQETNELYGCIRGGDRSGALAALDAISNRCGATLVSAQLTRWAHQELSTAVTDGRDETQALWWLEQMCDPVDWPLSIRVARMCDPALAGHAGLPALVARAEELADELTARTTGTVPTPMTGRAPSGTPAAYDPAPTVAPAPVPVPVSAGVPTAVSAPVAAGPSATPTAPITGPTTSPAEAPSRTAPNATPVAPPAATQAPETLAPAAPAPAVPATAAPSASAPGVTDADILTLLNRIGRHGGAAALAVRRGTVTIIDGAFHVTAADSDGKVAEAVHAAAAELGWTVTFTPS